MASVPRIWTDQNLATGQTLELAPDAAHHLARVLRRSNGDAVCLCNGNGHEYRAEIFDVRRNRVTVRILSDHNISRESPLQVHLGQALSAPRRFDLALQKATELGVAELTPLNCRHCSTKVDSGRVEDRHRHWQGVLTSACEQSGRTQLPVLHEPASLGSWIAQLSVPLIYLDPGATGKLEDISRPSSCALLIGPEGGLSPEELDLLQGNNICTGISLGPRILRTETAPLAALSILQYLWGDLGGP